MSVCSVRSFERAAPPRSWNGVRLARAQPASTSAEAAQEQGSSDSQVPPVKEVGDAAGSSVDAVNAVAE